MLKSKLMTGAIALALAVGMQSVWAGGGGIAGGGATEWTQMMNNMELAKSSLDAAVTANATVKKYILQMEQYKREILNSAGIDKDVLTKSVADLGKNVNDLLDYQNSLKNLQGDLEAQKNIIDSRMTEARLKKLPWQDYVKVVATEAAAGAERAKYRLANEEKVLKQVNKDYEYASEMYDKIPAAVGQEQSLQYLNSQMNRLVSQNALLTSILAKAGNSDAAQKEIKESEAAARDTATYDSYVQLKKALAQRQASALEKP